MKTPSHTSSPPQLSRRTLFAGAGAAGAVAAVAGLLSTPRSPVETEALAPDAPKAGGGYRLSEHIKQYYQTTRL